MKETRLHHRGGQGPALSAEIGAAFLADGKYASGFPMCGFEKRGAHLKTEKLSASSRNKTGGVV
jgi:Pyruvate/2-oxoacid:ferredoxin oxidoreductase gamma subunit